MTARWQLTDDIFNEALNRPPSERENYLAEACGADHELRRDVESLLRYASDSESYLQAVVEETARELRASLPCGEGARIGPYGILLHRGAVYRYFGVPAQIHEELLRAESKGGYFNRYVRNRFPYAKILPMAPIDSSPLSNLTETKAAR